jgi:cell division transport system permease protein
VVKEWTHLIQNLKREKLMSLSNMFVMTITFLLLGVFINVIVFTQTALKYLEQQAQVTVFFKDDFSEQYIMDFKAGLEKDSRIAAVSYISKEEALRIFKEINKDEPILLESISAGILPASLEVSAKNIASLKLLSEEFRQKDGVEEVRFFEDVIARFKMWSTVIYIVGFLLVVIFFVISYSVIIGTLRTTINSKGMELEIMKLVGASDSYVKNPLVYQGVFFGLVSSSIAALIMLIVGIVLTALGVFSQGVTLGFLPGIMINVLVFTFILVLVLILSGFLLGYYGSGAAIKKYLKY